MDFPEGYRYRDYEIPLEARQNLREIERCLEENLYDGERMVRDHLDLLENLDLEITNAMDTERKIGLYNATLKHDQEKVRNLIKQLEEKLKEVEKKHHRK